MSRSDKLSWESVLLLAFLLTMALAIVVIALSRPTWSALTALALAAVVLALLVRWHARSTAYRCPSCEHQFSLSAWKDFVRPHGGDRKYIRCPRCGESGWCKEVSDTGR